MEKWKTHLQKCSLFLGGLIVTLALFLPNTVGANDYYVSTEGNDSNPGTIAASFQTIRKGVTYLTAGDTLYVKAGTYDESILSWQTPIPNGTSWDNPVTVAAYPGDTVTIRPPSGSAFFEVADGQPKYLIIDGFIVDGGNDARHGFVFTGNTRYIRVQNSEIKNAKESGIRLLGVDSYHEFIKVNVYHNGMGNGIEGNPYPGFYIMTSGNLIENCQIHDNAGGGIHVNGGAEGPRTKGNIFRDNRIRNNGREGITINRSDDNLIYNNIVWNNENGILVGPFGNPKGTKVYNNTVYANQEYGIGVFAGAIDTEVLNNISHDISTNIFNCRIMPLGDSITYDNNVCDAFAICPPAVSPRSPGQRTGYRKPLLEFLEAAGYRHHVDFDFVGSEKGGGDLMVDPDNAGFPGITTAQLRELLDTGTYLNTVKGGWLDHENGTWWGDDVQWVENKPTTLKPYLESHPADIILLHIGTNGLDPNPQNVENLLMEIDEYERNHNKVMVILARIINRRCSMDQPPCNESSRTKEFNDNVEAMVRGRIDNGDRIIMVDMQDGAGIDYQMDMLDNLHPNKTGFQKMAVVWKNALANIQLPPRCNLARTPDVSPPGPPSDLSITN